MNGLKSRLMILKKLPKSNKMFRTLCLFVACASIGCTRVVFDVPQPAHRAALEAFPKEYRGVYLPEEGNDSLIISERAAHFIEYNTIQLPVKSLDTLPQYKLKDGRIYDAEHPDLGGLPYTIHDTMLHYHFTERFTIGLSDTVVIKETPKYLVVSSNFRDDEVDYWDVLLVRLTGNTLTTLSVGNLKTPTDDDQGDYDGNIESFGKIVPYEQIGEKTFLFRPTEKQFNKLVKKKLFAEKEVYRKS
jgi:hypothetical protein